jgi:fatty acid desaturase
LIKGTATIMTQAELRFSVPASDIAAPVVAYPTLLLFVFGLLGFAVSLNARLVLGLHAVLSVPMTTVFVFILFTPMHDASHLSIATRAKWINSAVGWICSLVFIAPYPAFRWVHMLHHKYTNDPARDPDYWSGSGPIALLPLRWLSQEFHYYVPYLGNLGSRPRAEAVTVVVTIVALWSSVVWAALHGQFATVAVAWLLPTRLAVCALAYSFDYVPHRPHSTPRSQSLYGSTAKVDGLLQTGGVALTVPLLGQDDHAVHHVYPHLPFYMYHRVWARHREQFLKAGTPVTAFYRRDRPWW